MEHYFANKYHVFLYLVFHFSLLNPSTALYLYRCSTTKTFAANSPYQFNLDTLLASLSSSATASAEFYNTTAGGRNSIDTVYGLFMCRGDVPHQVCRDCVVKGTQQLASVCQLMKEGIIWYEECFVRYSNRSFFSTVDEWPRIGVFNTVNITNKTSFTWTLANTLSQVVAEAANFGPVGTKKFVTKKVGLSIADSHTLYTLAQCTPDLSSQDCHTCLRDAMGDIPWCCLGKAGGRVAYPSCKLRFELYQFYWETSVTKSPINQATPFRSDGSSGRTGKRKIRSRTIIIIIASVLVSMMFVGFGGYYVRRRASKSLKAILEKSFGNQKTLFESLHFDLATIETATNKFSLESRIGKGGFGEVFKGILPNGEEIAVKRLSSNSGQGNAEFNNEIFLIAKLQHRNLVTLLGFCVQEKEKILVYEYVSNKSLDYFLFDSQKRRLLNWSMRHKIIGGIVGGILYLHEQSRLKVIHRDLKPSNILLDDKMNPKISDFGMAKLVSIDEAQGRTRRVVGTQSPSNGAVVIYIFSFFLRMKSGYMSPEYALLGKFSEKSDIFSFGVMVLEIITGKRNSSSYESHYADGLLNYVWKQWRDQTPLEILDPNLQESYSETEVIKCIKIGLLCVQANPNARPPMATIASYFSSLSVQLPSPQEPAFYIHGSEEPNLIVKELDGSNQTAEPSINQMSVSRFLPR